MPYSRMTNLQDNSDTCVQDCGLRYFTVDQVCIQCDFRCLSCSSTSNSDCPNCDTSVTGVIRKGINTCGCAEGYTADTSERKCLRNFVFDA